jgi:hypothetical protein
MITFISSGLMIEQLHNYERKTLCCILFVLVTAMNVVILLVFGTVPVQSS